MDNQSILKTFDSVNRNDISSSKQARDTYTHFYCLHKTSYTVINTERLDEDYSF